MRWTRSTFPVLLQVPGRFKPEPLPVAGIASGAFGIFQGDKSGPDLRSAKFSLVLTGSGGFLCISSKRVDLKTLAEELAQLRVNWSATDPKQITGPGIATARELIRCGHRSYAA